MAVATLCARSVLSIDPAAAFDAAPCAEPETVTHEPTAATPDLTLNDLMAMKGPALHEVMRRGHAIDPDAIAGRQFLGVD